MSDEVIKILDELAKRFGLTIDWTSSNVIPYLEKICNKYVNYEVATSVVWLLFGIACLILGGISFKKMKHYFVESNDSENSTDEEWYGGLCIFAGFVCVIAVVTGLIVVMCQTFDIVTCVTFPEKIVIEELELIIGGN